MAGTRCTVPTAQSASSTYREEGGRKGASDLEERTPRGERELNKEGKRRKRDGDENKAGKRKRKWEGMGED